MPMCCIKQCRTKSNTSIQPSISLHRFPANETLKNRWLEVIGRKNINPRHKTWFVCSLHFHENCFNRTLDVIRLRDGVVPSSSLLPNQICSENDEENLFVTTTQQDTVGPMKPLELILLQEEENSVTTSQQEAPTSSAMVPDAAVETIKKLNLRCINYMQKIKCLNEKVRRQAKIIAELRKPNMIKRGNIAIFEVYAKDFPKNGKSDRGIIKKKILLRN